MSDIIWPGSVAAGDFNMDEVSELVMTCEGESEAFGICLLESTGNIFRMDVDWLETGYAQVHVADFNGDNRPDILLSEWRRFAVFSFVAGEFTLLSELIFDPEVLDEADSLLFPTRPIDINNDGQPEIVAGSNFNGFRVWEFDSQLAAWAAPSERHSLFGCGDLEDSRVGDLDNNGTLELVAISSHNDCDDGPSQPGSQWDQVSLFASDSISNDLISIGSFAAEISARRLDLGDFNGDDIVDIVLSDRKDVMVFAGNGDGTFASALPLIGLANFSGTGPHAADFNADGIDELLVEQQDESYRILLGLPIPAAVDLPFSISLVRLVEDLNNDLRADIVSLAKSEGQYRLVLTVSQD